MKHGKRPTRAQKIRIKSHGLNPDHWLIVKDCRECFQIVHRTSGESRKLIQGREVVDKCITENYNVVIRMKTTTGKAKLTMNDDDQTATVTIKDTSGNDHIVEIDYVQILDAMKTKAELVEFISEDLGSKGEKCIAASEV